MNIIFKVFHLIVFIIFYLKRIVKANISVAYEVLTPQFKMKPAIIEVPLNIKKDHAILAMTNLISLTPGTLTLDISANRDKLYIHSMFVHDADIFMKDIEQLEKHIQKLLT
ncbi:MAG: Na+/H+ antiporter subunit E [Candidatus Cyclobacteriaceae bacterium M2_1C_046]